MKSLVTLQLAVLRDAGLHCATSVSRDEATLRQRVEHEGESFLTITLPLFAKALEKGLDSGQWPRHALTGFSHSGGLPRFLSGFLARVFSKDGALLDEPDAEAIWAVRQICGLTGKMDRACTPDRERDAMMSFIETDQQLAAHFDEGIPNTDWDLFDRHVLAIFGDLFDHLETRVSGFDLIPGHGPGAVADRLDHPQRWEFGYWTQRLDEVFPRWRYAQNLPVWHSSDLVSPEDEIPVKVISVPKTQAKPRIIAIEPSTMQFAQQGLKREIYAYVRKSPLFDVLGFTDQTRNQRLAKLSSLDGSLATLDLSEASDRVHATVVERLLYRWPHVLDFVMATRSRNANVGGEVIPLTKFASMGSALTFPIEAIIFTVIASMGVWGGRAPASVALMRDVLSVYGDDIIVPVDRVADVVHYLETFGFKVNRHKSFWNGKFRESCGKEYYDGTDVSIIRLRADVPTSRRDAALIRRFTDFRNRCYRAGLWQTVKEVDKMLSSIMSVPHRHVEDQLTSPANVLAFDTVLPVAWKARFNTGLQRWEQRFPSVRSDPRPYTVEGAGGVLKWFSENHERSIDFQHDAFESQERAHTFHIKWAWIERLPKRSMV